MTRLLSLFGLTPGDVVEIVVCTALFGLMLFAAGVEDWAGYRATPASQGRAVVLRTEPVPVSALRASIPVADRGETL